jgi:hypothetical protein
MEREKPAYGVSAPTKICRAQARALLEALKIIDRMLKYTQTNI